MKVKRSDEKQAIKTPLNRVYSGHKQATIAAKMIGDSAVGTETCDFIDRDFALRRQEVKLGEKCAGKRTSFIELSVSFKVN